MKLSYVVCLPDINNPNALGYRGTMEESFSALARYGYKGVELMVADPSRIDRKELKAKLNKYDLELADLCTGELYGQEGLSFADPDPEIRKKAMERARAIAELAGEFGSPINVGRLRGTYVKGFPREKTEKLAAEGLWELAEYAERQGAKVLLEPLNRLEATLIISTAEGLKWLERVKHDNLLLMMDLFHMHLQDISVESGLVMARDKFDLVHICDHNRRYPGSGQLNFPSIISILNSLGYEGFLSAEFYQYPDQETALEKTSEFMLQLI